MGAPVARDDLNPLGWRCFCSSSTHHNRDMIGHDLGLNSLPPNTHTNTRHLWITHMAFVCQMKGDNSHTAGTQSDGDWMRNVAASVCPTELSNKRWLTRWVSDRANERPTPCDHYRAPSSKREEPLGNLLLLCSSSLLSLSLSLSFSPASSSGSHPFEQSEAHFHWTPFIHSLFALTLSLSLLSVMMIALRDLYVICCMRRRQRSSRVVCIAIFNGILNCKFQNTALECLWAFASFLEASLSQPLVIGA